MLPPEGGKLHFLQTFGEEELDDLCWQQQAPYLEPTSYLVKPDGSGCLAAVGKEVVLIKEGYFEQCRVLKQEQVDPCWTSFGLRRWQCISLTGSMLAMQQDGIGYCRIGLVERCKVIGITYHRRKVQERGVDSSGDAAAGQVAEAGGLQTEEIQQDEFCGGSVASISEGSEASAEEEGGEPVGQFFVRVTLQRLPQKNDRLGPVCTVIEHFVDCGVGEWIIPRDRYEATMSKWKKGDGIQMYWADQVSSGRGQWWAGTVVGIVKRKPDDPFKDSPWAAVTIRWSETNSTDNISPWELQPAEDEFRASGSDSGFESDWDVAEPREASEDEDWGTDARRPRDGRRRKQGARWASPCSADSDDSFDLEPSRKRQRLAAAHGIPVTMLPRKSKGTVDWNKGHCAICMSRPDGSLVLECDGTCLRSFHARCLSEEIRPSQDEAADASWFCADCRQGQAQCAVCRQKGRAGYEVLKCKLGGCGNHFHPACLRRLAATNACLKIHRDSGEASTSSGRIHLTFTCPSHYCDRCHLSGDSLKIYRCWTCLKAFHGKCMERTEVKLNEREMECTGCVSKRAAPAAAAAQTFRPGHAPGVVVWQPDKASASVQAPKVTKWTASIIDLKVKRKVDLVGKSIFHFGSHKKGGGCDFLVPLQNVKFHSELKVLPDGNVVISYCHNKARELAEIEITTADQKRYILGAPEHLRNGDKISIADAEFSFQLRPWEPAHLPLLLI